LDVKTDRRQVGDELVITRRTSVAVGIYAPDRLKEVAAWFREMGKDDAKMIMIAKK